LTIPSEGAFCLLSAKVKTHHDHIHVSLLMHECISVDHDTFCIYFFHFEITQISKEFWYSC